MSNNLLENLNKEQLEAVTHTEGPLMIIAGAGTGKTTAITQRMAWLIEQGKAKADEILALTFTEKASNEMEERVDQLLPIGYVDMWISTFHAFCERILRENALEIGVPDQFNLLDEVDTFLLLRKNINELKLNYYKPRGNPTRFIRALVTHFSRMKDETISPAEYLDFAKQAQLNFQRSEIKMSDEDKKAELSELERIQELANAYKIYQQILLENNAMDFADLVSYTIELFKTRPAILKQYQNQFKYILVDEFQDTNLAQYELIKLLTKPPYNLTIVGDDDQSIYKFRGASLSNIMLFKQDFPTTKSIVLNRNYRSYSQILDQAYNFIQKNNPNRLEIKEQLNKKLIAHKTEKGIVEHINCPTLENEISEVIIKIINLKKETECRWNDFCILTRANNHAEPFLLAMDELNIPYKFLALSGLYTKPLIIDILSYLRAIDQPHTSTAIYKILSHPTLGIINEDITKLTLFAKQKTISLFNAMKICPDLSKESIKKIREILTTINEISNIAKRKTASEVFVDTIHSSGLLIEISKLNDVEQIEQNDLLQQFFSRIKRFEINSEDRTLHEFLKEFEQERESGESGGLKIDPSAGPDVINIMTIHASKGLEFKYVFIINLVEQRFPSRHKKETITTPQGLIKERIAVEGDPHIEEERRLFYVALTRAKEGVFLFSAEDYGGKRKRKPSRFIQELNITTKNAIQNNEVFAQNKQGNKQQTKPATINYQLPKRLSFTQIAAYTKCPMQYKFAHILNIPIFGNYQMSFGKSMHNTLEKIIERIITEQKNNNWPTEKQALLIYEDNWIDEWYPDKDTKNEYYKNGQRIITEYYKILTKQKPQVAFIEKAFTLKIRGISIKGRIDRIDKLSNKEYEVIDYKSGKPKTKLNWDDKRQLVLYAMAIDQCFDPPIKIKKLTYHYLDDNSDISFEPNEKDKIRLENEILEVVEGIKAIDFHPASNEYTCKNCDFKDICNFSAI